MAIGLLITLPLLGALLLTAGCRQSSSRPMGAGSTDPETKRAQRRELLSYAIQTLAGYEQHEDLEMLQRAVNRLDQWVREQEPIPDWELDPMVATLPAPLPEAFARADLGRLAFPDQDVYALQEAVWLRDVSKWARGDALDPLGRAKRLFDWTVRNIRLEWPPSVQGTDPAPQILQKPWETLLLGRGTATDRAWVFILLARQQRIDAALLAVLDPNDPQKQKAQPWVIGVLIEGQIYLFEPTLGLPIPAPDGVSLGPAGQLEIRPATLAQVAADGALLRQLDAVDADAEYRYRAEAEQAQRVVAMLEASPTYLTQRMKLLESQLAGDERLVLSADPSTQAKRFRDSQHVADALLWPRPYWTLFQESTQASEKSQWLGDQLDPFFIRFDTSPTIQRRSHDAGADGQWWKIEARMQSRESPGAASGFGRTESPGPQARSAALWRARLSHLKHKFTGERSATFYYGRARVPDTELPPEEVDPAARLRLTRAKMHASYWLGLIAAEQGEHATAVDWLATRTLKLGPDGSGAPGEQLTPWTPGAIYNLARVYEADGQAAKAIQVYRSDPGTPYRHGNLLRARWLESLAMPQDAKRPEPRTTEGPAPGDDPKKPAKPEAEKPMGDEAQAGSEAEPEKEAPADPNSQPETP